MAELKNWLQARGLERYSEMLESHDIDIDILPQLTDTDLAAAGLPIGARKRLLKAFQAVETLAPEELPLNEFEQLKSGPERRHLTVVFCDVVGSTSLAEEMDAEDLRDLLLSFQAVCAEVVERNGGRVGLFIGDGVTAYFGYPKAQEDSASHAVQASLEILDSLAKLQIDGLKARCGVHSGSVIVGEMGAGEKRLFDGIVGEAPNIAARIQGLASPGCVIISDATLSLVRAFFQVEPLGPRALKGVTAPIAIHRVLGPRTSPSRFDAYAKSVLTPLVGRETEISLLVKRWHEALEGEAQTVLLRGDAGIGKSRLVAALQDRLSSSQHAEIALHCFAQRQTSSLWPLRQHLRTLVDIGTETEQNAGYEHLRAFLAGCGLQDSDVVVPLGSFLDLLPHPPPESLREPERLRRSIFRSLAQVIASFRAERPMLLILEDAHWIDPSTAEFVGQLLSENRHNKVLTVITARPEFIAPWFTASKVLTLPIARLSRKETALMVTGMASHAVPPALLDQLIAKSDGVPLFIEELTKAMAGTQKSLATHEPFEVPATLQAALQMRLDQLAPIRQIIQTAALLGRVFDVDLLTEAARQDSPTIRAALRDLVDADLIYPLPGIEAGRYEFKHALIQDAAVSNLLREPRGLIEHAISQALLKLRADMVAQNPEVLALHLQGAGAWAHALSCWQQAGAIAIARAAAQEATSHFTNAVQCSKKLDVVPGGAERLAVLHMALANAIMQSESYNSTRLERALEEAKFYAESTTSLMVKCQATLSFAAFLYAKGRNRDCVALADSQIQELADQLPATYMGGLWTAKGVAHFNLGEQRLSLAAFQRAVDLHCEPDPERRLLLGGGDTYVVATVYRSRVLTLMGSITEAVTLVDSFMTVLPRLNHPFDAAWALLARGEVFGLLGKYDLLEEIAGTIVQICDRHGFGARRGNGLILRGIARAGLGHLNKGIADLREGLQAWKGQGVVFHTAERTALLCDLFVQADQLDTASMLLDEVDDLIAGTDEACYLSECLRIRGRIASARGDEVQAIRSLEQAITIAQHQEALMLELRATSDLAVSLARLGRSSIAAERLTVVISKFEADQSFIVLKGAQSIADTIGAQSSTTEL